MSKEKIALYAGSFDPITRGHLDILSKALQTFDRVHIAMGTHPKKQRLFDLETSMRLIIGAIDHQLGPQEFRGWHESSWTPDTVTKNKNGSIVIGTYPSKTVIQHANDIGATHIVRGLRQAGDFNDEFTLAGVAGHLDPDIIFTHFICREEFLHISSSTARELALYNEDISWLVTPNVEEALLAKQVV